jgi:hypothetical protein
MAASSARRSVPAKARQQQRAVVQAGDAGARIWRGMSEAAASFLPGNWPAAAAHVGHGFADRRLGGGNRAAGNELQVADCGAGRQAVLVALGTWTGTWLSSTPPGVSGRIGGPRSERMAGGDAAVLGVEGVPGPAA